MNSDAPERAAACSDVDDPRRQIALAHLRTFWSGRVRIDERMAGGRRRKLSSRMVWLVADMADRPPRLLANQEVINIGGKRFRYFDTPHVPHGWDAGILFEKTTHTLFCGDLFAYLGNPPALTSSDIIGPAMAIEDLMHPTSLGLATAPTIRKLPELRTTLLATMHGASFSGNGTAALEEMGDHFDKRLRAALGPERP